VDVEVPGRRLVARRRFDARWREHLGLVREFDEVQLFFEVELGEFGDPLAGPFERAGFEAIDHRVAVVAERRVVGAHREPWDVRPPQRGAFGLEHRPHPAVRVASGERSGEALDLASERPAVTEVLRRGERGQDGQIRVGRPIEQSKLRVGEPREGTVVGQQRLLAVQQEPVRLGEPVGECVGVLVGLDPRPVEPREAVARERLGVLVSQFHHVRVDALERRHLHAGPLALRRPEPGDVLEVAVGRVHREQTGSKDGLLL
jgi:hypothetical protein